MGVSEGTVEAVAATAAVGSFGRNLMRFFLLLPNPAL